MVPAAAAAAGHHDSATGAAAACYDHSASFVASGEAYLCSLYLESLMQVQY